MLVPPPPTSSLAYSTKLLSLTTTRCFVFWCPFHTATTSAGFWLWLLFWGRPLLAFSFFAHTDTHTHPPSIYPSFSPLCLPLSVSPHLSLPTPFRQTPLLPLLHQQPSVPHPTSISTHSTLPRSRLPPPPSPPLSLK